MPTLIRPLTGLLAAFTLGILLSADRAASAQTVGPGHVLFTEFRLSGPAGFADEYLELFCNRDVDCDVSNYVIVAFDPSFGDFTVTFPESVVIPARGHLLVGDDFGYSLNSYATPDLLASFGGAADFFVDNEGFQLRSPDQNTVIDSVGFAGGGGSVTYAEGAGLQRTTAPRPADQYAYVRKAGPFTGGFPQDTNNNADDFVLVSVTGASHPGITLLPVLGAPGPENLTSPLMINSAALVSLVEPSVSNSASPNRVRTGSGNSGTISIRRAVTNNTGEQVSLLRFRVVDITTLNSPGYAPGGGQADLRLVTSGDAETFVNSLGRTVFIRGTVLEFSGGDSEPNQPNGGGLNTSAVVNVSPVAPGETVDVQFLLNVTQAGNFRFYINVEAVAGGEVKALNSGAPRFTKSAPAPKSSGARRLSARRRFSTTPPYVLGSRKLRD